MSVSRLRAGEPSGLTWADLAWLRGEHVAPNAAIADKWSGEIHEKIAALIRRDEHEAASRVPLSE